MSSWPVKFLCLLIGIAGWHYLFYSRAAEKLGAIEASRANVKRVRLRRANGVAMIVLATLLYLGSHAIDPGQHPRVFVLVWMCVFALLLLVVVLALIDVRFTTRLRAEQRRNRE